MGKKIYQCKRCGYIWRSFLDEKPIYCPKCYRASITEVKKTNALFKLFQKLKKKAEEFKKKIVRKRQAKEYNKAMLNNNYYE